MPQNTMNRNSNAPQGNGSQDQEACSLSGGLPALLGGHGDANVGDLERVVSVMGGGLLTLFGATRGGLAGLGLAIMGGGLIYRGVTGHCEAYHSLGVDTTDGGREAASKVRGAHI